VKKTTLAILTATLTAGSAMQPVAAQGYYDRDRNYNGQYNQYNTYEQPLSRSLCAA